MSIWGSIFTAISGMNCNGTSMELIGNNIANINTPAYKSSRTEFAEVLSGTKIGGGSQIAGISAMFSQGSLQATQNVTDLAIEGSGFFMVRSPRGLMYTRAGNFKLDDNGYMVNPSGAVLQGYRLDENGNKYGSPEDISIPTAPMPPRPTGDGSNGSGVQIEANLDSNEDVIASGFDISDPEGTSNFSTSMTVYDSLGNSHLITVYFTKTIEVPGTGNTWQYTALIAEEDLAPGGNAIGTQGTLVFDTEGALLSEIATTPSSFDFSGGAELGQVIGFNFGESVAEGGTGLNGTTQFGDSSAVHNQTQDGYSPSYLVDIGIDNSGIIYGMYANGENRNFCQIALADFMNPCGLNRVGGNGYMETLSSGQPLIGTANEGGRGQMYSNTLELSNVDLAEEFVKMIITQRGFQANSRFVSANDELLSELINLRR